MKGIVLKREESRNWRKNTKGKIRDRPCHILINFCLFCICAAACLPLTYCRQFVTILDIGNWKNTSPCHMLFPVTKGERAAGLYSEYLLYRSKLIFESVEAVGCKEVILYSMQGGMAPRFYFVCPSSKGKPLKQEAKPRIFLRDCPRRLL
jgi:hypothetical protein